MDLNIKITFLGMCIAVALVLTAGSTSGAVFLLETGGTFETGNLATASGAMSFAKDTFGGGSYCEYRIENVKDSLYGNSFSWIGSGSESFIGIHLAQSAAINRIAWGRDNTGAYSDRCLGTYTVQYTTVEYPEETTPDDDWHDLFTRVYTCSYPASPGLRHLWQFDPVTATGIRIKTANPDPPLNLICIDEIELYYKDAVPVVYTAADLEMVLAAMDSTCNDPNWNADVDLDNDGEITSDDLAILLVNVE